MCGYDWHPAKEGFPSTSVLKSPLWAWKKLWLSVLHRKKPSCVVMTGTPPRKDYRQLPCETLLCGLRKNYGCLCSIEKPSCVVMTGTSPRKDYLPLPYQNLLCGLGKTQGLMFSLKKHITGELLRTTQQGRNTHEH